MRTVFLAMLVTVLSGSTVLADPAARQKPDYAVSPGRLLPVKGMGAGNPCAAFGPGFMKVEGTDTCMKVGGAVRVDVSGSAGPR
ncbi:porin [Bradyrhizobium sp. dw_78]|uniref:porin n=1 Tax=Bradyrhizobium sp. dw_78 TaxID=2719793 RepID=UPI00201C1EF8|nr:porin [Bradyrhizobium sp. dw_78]